MAVKWRERQVVANSQQTVQRTKTWELKRYDSTGAGTKSALSSLVSPEVSIVLLTWEELYFKNI